jgi:membrane-associated phospholipid phosphatase
MKPAAEAQVQQAIAQTAGGQRVLRRRAIWRTASVLGLLLLLTAFLEWLGPPSRDALVISLVANRPLIALVLGFGIIALSLLWSAGQRLDAWVFALFNLRGYHALWVDRAMWLATQLGSMGFSALLAAGAYVLGNVRYAIDMMLGTLTLWLVVETVKAVTDRARPFNLLRETRVVGWRVPGLSFPSGHTAQIFFAAALTSKHFALPPNVAIGVFAIAALVGFTRVYVGAHYPRDVIAGAILGAVWGILSALVAPYI